MGQAKADLPFEIGITRKPWGKPAPKQKENQPKGLVFFLVRADEKDANRKIAYADFICPFYNLPFGWNVIHIMPISIFALLRRRFREVENALRMFAEKAVLDLNGLEFIHSAAVIDRH